MATDFHIGGVVGDSLELYFMSKVTFLEDPRVGFSGMGVVGAGLTYPLNSDFYINGGVGVGFWAEIDATLFSSAPPPENYEGFGLVVGGGYHLSDRWVLDFDIMYADPGEGSVDVDLLVTELSVNFLIT